MGALYFFLRSLAITVVVVFLLQIRVGDHTLEDRALIFIHDSSIAEPLQDAAEGGVTLLRDLWNRVTRNLNTDFARSINLDNQPGRRSFSDRFDRSQKYLEEKTRLAARKVKKTLDSEVRDYAKGEMEDSRLRLRRIGTKLSEKWEGSAESLEEEKEETDW